MFPKTDVCSQQAGKRAELLIDFDLDFGKREGCVAILSSPQIGKGDSSRIRINLSSENRLTHLRGLGRTGFPPTRDS